MQLLERIYQQALPALEGKRVREVRIGLGLLAVELDDGSLAVSYVLRDELPPGCTVIPADTPLSGVEASEMAVWAFKGRNPLLSSLGVAVLNSAVDPVAIERCSRDTLAELIHTDDQIGMIGYIEPMAQFLKSWTAKELIIFDRSREPFGDVYPESRQRELLPQCDILLVTGTTLLNRSLDLILQQATNAREIILVGTSTPLYPEAFRDTKVTQLAGSLWRPEYRAAIFSAISEARGMRVLSKYGKKVFLAIPKGVIPSAQK
ncbi:MAG: Rossmann-like domain-containing protein [Candidatus Methanospirareceae archaeon]